MIHIPRFNVYIPKDVSDALSVLSQRKDLIPMGGGSDLLVLIKSGIVKANTILDLWPLRKELAYIKRENDVIRIGALTTISELCESDLIKDVRYAGLADVCKKFSTPFIRNIATVGGNVGAAHPLSDIALMLLVLNGKVKLLSKNGERVVDIMKFFKGKRQTVRSPDEIIAEVSFAETPPTSSTAFIKFDRRWGHAMGYVLVGAYMQLRDNVIEDVRIAFDSMGNPYPERAWRTEEFLRGKEFSDELIKQALNDVLPKEMKRISDYRASAEYRLELSKVLLRRALLKIRLRIKGGD